MLEARGELPPFGSAELVHRTTEVAKLALADREAWYGDVPDVPVDELLSAGYAKERAALVGEQASRELRPGAPNGRAPRLPRAIDNQLVPMFEMGGLGEPTVSRY